MAIVHLMNWRNRRRGEFIPGYYSKDRLFKNECEIDTKKLS